MRRDDICDGFAGEKWRDSVAGCRFRCDTRDVRMGVVGAGIVGLSATKVPDAVIHVRVREQSRQKLATMVAKWPGAERSVALIGDLTVDNLGIEGEPPAARNIIHLSAVYDMTAAEDTAHAANVRGTERVIALATRNGAMMPHVSSVAVAGDHRGEYSESGN